MISLQRLAFLPNCQQSIGLWNICLDAPLLPELEASLELCEVQVVDDPICVGFPYRCNGGLVHLLALALQMFLS